MTFDGALDAEVMIARIPRIALLDLTTYEIKELNPTISANAITVSACNDETLHEMVMDAACSPVAGESKFLVVSPSSTPSCPNLNRDPTLPYKRNQVWVYPDPIGQPLKMGAVLDANVTDATW